MHEEWSWIEIFGLRRPARINIDPPFDPSGDKMLG